MYEWARSSFTVVVAVSLLGVVACAAPTPAASANMQATLTPVSTSTSRPAPLAASDVSATSRPKPTLAPKPKRIDGLLTVYAAELPNEAQRTLGLIARGGPFPFEKDGAVFQNRERILPQKARGYYREYTVITPGEDDRGARRIVAGRGGELYYTDDHYDSFVRVILP